MQATTARILDKRRMLKKTNTYPLAIPVTYNRTPVRFPIGIYLSCKDYEKLSSPRIGERLASIREKFEAEEKRAKEIIESMGTFTFPAFRERFCKGSQVRNRRKASKLSGHDTQDTPPGDMQSPTGLTKKYGTGKFNKVRSEIDFEMLGPLAMAIGEYIKLLEAQDRIGSSKSHFFTLMNLLKFRRGLRLEDITVKFLFEFEKWMLAQGRSYTSIGMYLRNLRTVINLPENRKLFTLETYPFGKGKYQIPTGANVKKALDLTDIKKIYEYQPRTNQKNEMYARDIWLFGYFANGINAKDIACVKYEDITEKDFLIVQRQKTRFTTRTNPKKIVIPGICP